MGVFHDHTKQKIGFQYISFALLGISGSISFSYGTFSCSGTGIALGRIRGVSNIGILGSWGLSFVTNFVLLGVMCHLFRVLRFVWVAVCALLFFFTAADCFCA